VGENLTTIEKLQPVMQVSGEVEEGKITTQQHLPQQPWDQHANKHWNLRYKLCILCASK
jgi:hypothetical protein